MRYVNFMVHTSYVYMCLYVERGGVGSGRETEGSERKGRRERESDLPTYTSQVPLHLVSPSSFYPPIGGDLLELGRLLISKDSTIEDLKLMILTLPVVSHYRIK